MKTSLLLCLLAFVSIAHARQLTMPDGSVIELAKDASFINVVYNPTPPTLTLQEVFARTNAQGVREESTRERNIPCAPAAQCEVWRFDIEARIRALLRSGG